MAIEHDVPPVFEVPPGTPFYLGDPRTEFSGEEYATQGAVRFARLPLPPIPTRSRGVFVQGRFEELSADHPDASWGGWAVFIRTPRR